MNKITHKVRCEQWTSIIKECLASGMPKTTWCREHGISDKSFFTGNEFSEKKHTLLHQRGFVWEGDGFLLLYKRLNIGGFSWPRTKEEAMEITPEQFQMLMQGLSIVAKHPIKELKDSPKTMQYCVIRRKNILFLYI